jgi:hypothetical protein
MEDGFVSYALGLNRGHTRFGLEPETSAGPPAEQSVLGGMMLSKDAIADVVEEIRGTDFYRPAHEPSTTPSSTSTAVASPPTPSPSRTS